MELTLTEVGKTLKGASSTVWLWTCQVGHTAQRLFMFTGFQDLKVMMRPEVKVSVVY